MFTFVLMLKHFREITESLNLPDEDYHTGIKRDPGNNQIWRRVSDGKVVELTGGWIKGFPKNDVGQDFLYWDVYTGSGFVPSKGKIWNYVDNPSFFICETYA